MTDLVDDIELTLEKMRGVTFEREDVAALLGAFARHIGVDGLELDEHGATAITVDGDIDVTLIHLPPLPGLVVASAVAKEDVDGGAIARRLLRANLSWSVTQGGTFAMLPGSSELMLCRLIALAESDLDRLDHEIASFVDLVRDWRDEIEAFVEDANEPDEPDAEVGTDFVRV